MGVTTQKGEKGAKSTTSAGNIPVQQPRRPEPREQTTRGAEFQTASPGFNHTVTNYPSGWSHNTISGLNPSSIQTAQVHQTPGFTPSPGTFFPPNLPHNATIGLNAVPHYHPSQGHTPYNHIHFHPVSAPNMADYNLGSMPNTGQHFQPPVPDTTYGPIPHVYHPRFDGGIQAVVPGQTPATGITTAPLSMPMVAQPQPQVMVPNSPYVHHMSAQPVFAQPAIAQASPPAVVGGQTPMIIGNGNPGMSFPNPAPDVMGIGKTAGEVAIEHLNTAFNSNMLEPQEAKPADDDPSRMYMCRELDGNWTQRNRYSIDHMACRWFITEYGAFYAVRVED